MQKFFPVFEIRPSCIKLRHCYSATGIETKMCFFFSRIFAKIIVKIFERINKCWLYLKIITKRQTATFLWKY